MWVLYLPPASVFENGTEWINSSVWALRSRAWTSTSNAYDCLMKHMRASCACDYSPAGVQLRRVCPEESLVGSSQRNSGMHPTFTNTNYSIMHFHKMLNVQIQWWPKSLGHLAYLRGFSCFCWIGRYNTHKTNYCWMEGICWTLKWWTDPLKVQTSTSKRENKLIYCTYSFRRHWITLVLKFSGNILTLCQRCAAVITAKAGHTKY